MSSKIRIKFGDIEVEYEGSEEFIKEELQELLSSVAKMQGSSQPSKVTKNQPPPAIHPPTGQSGATGITGTTATLAAKLGGGSGAELLLAAAAQLTFVQGKTTFLRKELVGSAKSATGYWKASYDNNLTNYINARVKAGDLHETTSGIYSLSHTKKAEFENKLTS